MTLTFLEKRKIEEDQRCLREEPIILQKIKHRKESAEKLRQIKTEILKLSQKARKIILQEQAEHGFDKNMYTESLNVIDEEFKNRKDDYHHTITEVISILSRGRILNNYEDCQIHWEEREILRRVKNIKGK